MSNGQVISVTSVDGDTVIDCANRLVMAAKTLRCRVECMYNGIRLEAHPNSTAQDLVAFYNQRDNAPTYPRLEPAINQAVVMELNQGITLLRASIEKLPVVDRNMLSALTREIAILHGSIEKLSTIDRTSVVALRQEIEQLRVTIATLYPKAKSTSPSDPIADAHFRWLGESTKAERRSVAIRSPIDTNDLNIRVRKAIQKSKCSSPEELARFGRANLYQIQGVGESTVADIAILLHDQYGLHLED